MGRFVDKKVLITGASRGIGRGIALAFAAEGARVAVAYQKNQAAAEAVVEAAKASAPEAFAVAVDHAEAGTCEQLIHQLRYRWNGLDVLVNNAGVLDPIRPGEVGMEAFQHTLQVNLAGPYLLSRLAAPLLAAASGSIVNVSSIAAAGYPYASHYAASKAGLEAVTASLALELAPRVRVNAVAPGYTNTGDPMGWSEERMPELAAAIPLRRYGRPEDVAQAVLFLAEAAYVTGITLVVDGGLTHRLPGFASGIQSS